MIKSVTIQFRTADDYMARIKRFLQTQYSTCVSNRIDPKTHLEPMTGTRGSQSTVHFIVVQNNSNQKHYNSQLTQQL